MPSPTNTFDRPPSPDRYGAASRFEFDNPTKWVTVENVPLLDEHELTDDSGRPIATVDRSALEEIARNNNHKVRSTGDPATLILGHTSDDPRAPEKPAKGFVVNYSVRPFKRDEKTGKIIYAIHGDYKLKPQNAHLVDEYPRRSVELWWNKRDIDPIALLGGSSPERDLGAVIRNGRLNHVSLAHNPQTELRNGNGRDHDPEADVIRFHRRGQWVIENYAIPDPSPTRYEKNGKMGKVMSEFKHGTLHSGSKNGPKVTDPKQAKAIGMSEQRKASKKNEHCDDKVRYAEDEEGDTSGEDQYSPEDRERMDAPQRRRDTEDARRREQSERDTSELEGRRDRRKLPPGHGGGGGMGPGRYDAMDNDGPDTHDPGDEGVPADSGSMDDDLDGGEGDEESPVMREVTQSKWAKGIEDKLDAILAALTGGPGGGEGMPGGTGGEEPGMPEMPPPQEAGTGAPPGGPPGAGGMGSEPPPPPQPEEEESRRGMGERPVQMNAGGGTGFPGQADGYIPGTGTKQPPSRRMSRTGSTGGKTMTATERQLLDKVQRLERRDRENRIRYAQSEAARRVDALVNQGYQFPDDGPGSVEETKKHFTDLLTNAPDDRSGNADVDYEEQVIRQCYQRRRPDPAQMSRAGLPGRYARNPDDESRKKDPVGDDGENFEPLPEECSEYADLVSGVNTPGRKKYSRKEAAQIIIRRRAR